jgi:TPR repeat protein
VVDATSCPACGAEHVAGHVKFCPHCGRPVERPVAERPNSELTDEELLRKAESGDAEAVKDVGVRADRAGDLQTARLWYRRAADLGHAGAVRNLGVVAEKEDGESREAEALFCQAFEMGSTLAAVNLVRLLLHQHRDSEAAEWLETSVECGELLAIAHAGIGFSDRGEREEAFALWRRGADLGELVSTAILAGQLYDLGEFDEAEEWARAGASKGSAACMMVIGVLARDREDWEEARVWLQAAADLGDKMAAEKLLTLQGVLNPTTSSRRRNSTSRQMWRTP